MLAVFGALAGCQACASAPPAPCAAPTAGDDACILPRLAQDIAAHKSWAASIEDVHQTCGDARQTIEATWGSHVAAEVIEGLSPKMPIPPSDAGTS